MKGRKAYRGADRRGTLQSDGLDDTYALATALLLAVTVGLGIVGSRHDTISLVKAAGLTSLFQTMTAAFAAVGFVLCVLRWRVAGDAAMLWVGAALLVYGVVEIGMAELIVPLLGTSQRLHALVPATYAAGFLGTAILLFGGLISPPVDAGLRPLWVVLNALAGVGILGVALDHAPAVTRHITNTRAGAGTGEHPVATLWLIVPMAGAGIAYVWKAARGRAMLGWPGTAILALTLAELASEISRAPGELWGPGAELLRSFGLLLLVGGTSLEIDRSYRQQGGRLLETEVARRTAETRTRALRASMRLRRHDVGNALMAIEGAASTLQRYNEVLDPATRTSLTEMLGLEIERLQGLVSQEEAKEAELELTSIVRAAVRALDDPGAVVIESPAPVGLTGALSEVTEAVRELLAMAVREAEDGRVRVKVAGEDGWAVMEASFSAGETALSEQRASIQGRLRGAVRGAPAEGLALRFIGSLVRQQNGELLVADASGDRELALRLRLPGRIDEEPGSSNGNENGGPDASAGGRGE